MLARSKKPQPVHKISAIQTQTMTKHDNNEPPGGQSAEQEAKPESANMLIFLQNCEQRLITFTLPKESCTLQEVLEQVNVPFSEDTHIQCMQNTNSEIDYFVSVGSTTRIEELLENNHVAAMDVETANCKQRVSECTDLDFLSVDRLIKIDREITGLEKLVDELHRVFSNDHVNIQDVQKLMAGYKSDPKDWRKYAKFDRFRYTRNLVDAGNGAFNIMIICWGPEHASAIHDHADSHCFMKVLSGRLEEIRYDWPDNVQPEILKRQKDDKPRRRCCSESEDDILNGTRNVSSNCQNGSCHNFGGKIDSNKNGNLEKQNGGRNGDNENKENRNDENDNEEYNPQDMKEIGRTRLDVNDVCYINDALGLHRMENPSHVDGAVSLHLYCPPFDVCRVFDARTGKPTEVKVTFWSMYGKKIKRVIESNHVADSQQ